MIVFPFKRNKMTKEVCVAMVRLMGKRMLTDSEACAIMGIDRTSWWKWKSRNRNNEWVREQIELMRGLKIDKAIERIEKSAEGEDLKQPDWRAAAWLVEKCAPERFGAKSQESQPTNNLNVQIMLDSVKRVFATTPANGPRIDVPALLSAPVDIVAETETTPAKPKRTIPKRKNP